MVIQKWDHNHPIATKTNTLASTASEDSDQSVTPPQSDQNCLPARGKQGSLAITFSSACTYSDWEGAPTDGPYINEVDRGIH